MTDEMVRDYKIAFGAYMDEVVRGLFTPPSPDVGFHACKFGLEAALTAGLAEKDSWITELKAQRDALEISRNRWIDLARKMRDELNAVNGTHVVVPREPTAEMIIAGCENNPTQWSDGTDDGFAADVANDVYLAMIAAAPPTPAKEVG